MNIHHEITDAKENKLMEILGQLDILRDELEHLIGKFEAEGTEMQINTLTEALDAMNDAHDALDDVLLDAE